MIFKINKGNHKKFRLPIFTFKKSLDLNIKLIGDFSYISDIKENQKDTNKIFGLSDGLTHHINSIRIGYRYINNEIQLMSYYYNDGKHYSEQIGVVTEDKEFNIKIQINKLDYQIIFENKKFTFNRTSNWWFIRYLLFPYFGGQETTKKDLKFEINLVSL